MSNPLAFASGFSGPTQPAFVAVLHAIGVAQLVRGMRLSNAFSERDIEEIRLLAAGRTGAQLYCLELGLALKFLRRGNQSAAIVQLLSVLHKIEWVGSREVTLGVPTYLFLAGEYRLVSGCLKVLCELTALRVFAVVGGRSTAVDLAAPSSWQTFQRPGACCFQITDTGLLLDDEDFPDMNDYPETCSRQRSDPALVAEVDHIFSAWTLLERYAPRYADWVSVYLRHVFIASLRELECETSGSSFDYPTAIFLNPHGTPVLTAESLVHEASHLALYTASFIEPVVHQGSDEQFFSPIKMVERPIAMVYYAAHATVNAVLFLRRVKSVHGLDEKEEAQLTRWENWVTTYTEGLGRSKCVTDMGRAIWERSLSNYYSSESVAAL